MNTSASVALAWTAAGPPAAPAVILVHSLGADSTMWDDQLPALQDRYRVICLDLRGHGRSPVPEGPYSLAALARDVVNVADAAGADRFHYVGISLGGLIGLWLGAHLFERLDTLVVASTAARVGTEALWKERIRAAQSDRMRQLWDAVHPRWFAPGFALAHPERFADVAHVFASTNPAGYAGCCAALAGADLRHEVAAIRTPALILGGSLDQATPLADAQWLRETIPGSTLEVLEGAAHLSNLDQREAFNRSLRTFLDRRSAP